LFDTSRVAKIIAEQTSFGEADHGRRRTGENAWYVAGLSHEFPVLCSNGHQISI